MQMAVRIDVVLAAVLIVCTVLGWRRGAFKSVIGIVVVLAALLGAGWISSAAAPMAADAIAPMISQQIEARVDRAVESALHGSGEDDLSKEDAAGLFSALGLYQKTAENMAEDAVEQIGETGKAVVETAMESMIRSVAAAVLFLVSFVLLLVLLKILSKFLGLLTAVPGLHMMNALGGAVFGLIEGGLILVALIWAVQFLAGSLPAQIAEQTVLFRFFAVLDPIALLTGM